MKDEELTRQLKRGDEKALALIIEKYSPYVSAVIGNQFGDFSDTETIEEIASDTFFSLWRNRRKLTTHHIRGWLGTTARNNARTYLRKKNIPCGELDENSVIAIEDDMFTRLDKREQCRLVSEALLKISPPERETLIRFYYYNQTTGRIAEETGINPETVKSRLKRGRGKLKAILERGGYFDEN